MEPVKIDWKKIDSRFVVDGVYEHINAPKWVDFLSPEDLTGGDDDEAWFCRPDCNHPKTAEDFLETRTPTSNSKLWRAAGVREVSPLKDWNQRDANLKRRGLGQSPNVSKTDLKLSENGDNQNPNNKANFVTAAFKSSSEKKKLLHDNKSGSSDDVPRLKSTFSAKNLFGSRDILSHVSDFCTELKKLTIRGRDRENEESLDEMKSQEAAETMKGSPRKILGEIKVKEKEKTLRKVLGEISEMEVKNEEKRLLLDVAKEKSVEIERGSAKEKPRRKKRADEAENVPISLNLEFVKYNAEERFLQIQTNPPTPQCFSASTKTTPSKAPRSKLMDRGGILQEPKQNEEVRKDEGGSVSAFDGRQPARALDVFWFLKPCTLSD